MSRQRKLYAGARLRDLREKERLNQRQFAERLGVSTSYLNQLENNQRPLSASVILALVDGFGIDVANFAADEGDRLVSDLSEALVDPLFDDARPSAQQLKIVASNSPDFAHAFLALQRAYQNSRDRLAAVDDRLRQGDANVKPLAYEEVRDFFHYKDNYIDWLDRGGEHLAAELALDGKNTIAAALERLQKRHGIAVVWQGHDHDMFRRFDPDTRRLYLSASLPVESQSFQLLQQLALTEEEDAIEQILDEAKFRTFEARAIAKIGLANYAAGATLMPYLSFIDSAHEFRHDLELLAGRFAASLEQIAHRLSTLQRPGARGVPFFFVRVDRAGTITKRHSATKLQFARFSGACPLWNVHQAFEQPGQIIRQLAETPDGVRYISLARTITKRRSGFHSPIRRYAIALGCQTTHAQALVYSEGLDLENKDAYDPIGISCRICDRSDCPQRAVPPIGRAIKVDHNKRGVVPFEIEDKERT